MTRLRAFIAGWLYVLSGRLNDLGRWIDVPYVGIDEDQPCPQCGMQWLPCTCEEAA